MSKDFGDFQTPLSLVKEVIDCILLKKHSWARVLEPTCGQGNFIKGLLETKTSPYEIQCIEIQETYVSHLREYISEKQLANITVRQANIFELNFATDLKWSNTGPLLILGNPPWVTNSELSVLDSNNQPTKTNFKGFSGFGAMTGESNFDIAEYIWIKLAIELCLENPTIALLCKTSVARNFLKFAHSIQLPIKDACIWRINSQKSFGTYVDACLFYVEIGGEISSYQAKVYQNLKTKDHYDTIDIINNQLVSSFSAKNEFNVIEGKCPVTWRQGLKHDAAAIFELTYDAKNQLFNKLGENVQVESDYIYPLFKSSDLGGKGREKNRRAVLVTQKYIGEDTHHLERDAPLLWAYLKKHKSFLDARKSSIYDNQPSFAIFGIGSYSFACYKVAISGMYKSLKFTALAPINNRPIVFDDTCYFIPCSSAQQAALITSLLNNPLCHQFLNSIIFWDAKRPITKKILQRIDLNVLCKIADKSLLLETANSFLKEMNRVEESFSAGLDKDLEYLLEDHFLSSNKRANLVSSANIEQVTQTSFLWQP